MEIQLHALKSALLVIVLMLTSLSVVSQDHRLGISISSIWSNPDFYQGFMANNDPNIQAIYADGSEADIIEKYQFRPILGSVLNYSYVVKNPRNRGVSLAIVSGLGFSSTSFEVTTPAITRLLDYGTIKSGVGKKSTYRFNYIDVKIGIEKIHSSANNRIEYIYGLGVKNLILVSSSVDELDLFRNVLSEDVFEARMLSKQNYLFMPYVNLGVSIPAHKNVHFRLNIMAGVTPTNIIRYESTIESQYDRIYETRGTSAYEQTSSFNFFYGGEAGIYFLL